MTSDSASVLHPFILSWNTRNDKSTPGLSSDLTCITGTCLGEYPIDGWIRYYLEIPKEGKKQDIAGRSNIAGTEDEKNVKWNMKRTINLPVYANSENYSLDNLSSVIEHWDEIGIPEKKIVKFGEKENFWPQNAPAEGPNGPCGPCSEIFYDWGKDTGCRRKECDPSCDCGRFIEVWNLVFTQFNRTGPNKLEELPAKNIDTGMGLERITAVMQGVKTNFETDLFVPVIEKLRTLTQSIKPSKLNAAADHVRAAVFCIASSFGSRSCRFGRAGACDE